jgi:hypothetical protein
MPAPFLLALVLFASCGAPPPTPADSNTQGRIQWEPIASWSGRGSQHLDSFQSDSGALRIEWEAKRTADATAAGSLKIVVHSAISGRPLAAAVLDHQGEGKGTVYFGEEPRVFFLDVTATGVDWKIAVSERVR